MNSLAKDGADSRRWSSQPSATGLGRLPITRDGLIADPDPQANGHSQAHTLDRGENESPRVLAQLRSKASSFEAEEGADGHVSNPLAPDYANPVPEKPKPKSNADFRKVRALAKAQRLTIGFLTNSCSEI